MMYATTQQELEMQAHARQLINLQKIQQVFLSLYVCVSI